MVDDTRRGGRRGRNRRKKKKDEKPKPKPERLDVHMTGPRGNYTLELKVTGDDGKAFAGHKIEVADGPNKYEAASDENGKAFVTPRQYSGGGCRVEISAGDTKLLKWSATLPA